MYQLVSKKTGRIFSDVKYVKRRKGSKLPDYDISYVEKSTYYMSAWSLKHLINTAFLNSKCSAALDELKIVTYVPVATKSVLKLETVTKKISEKRMLNTLVGRYPGAGIPGKWTGSKFQVS